MGRVEVRTLLLVDIVDSTALVEALGDRAAAELMRRIDRIARDLLVPHNGQEIDKTDGFLHLFDRPLDAVDYAIALHAALAALTEETDTRVAMRAGVHMGEVDLHRNTAADIARGAKPVEVEGLAKPTAARLMALAGSRQTLISKAAFDLARRAAVGGERDWVWTEHGAYAVKGVSEPIEVCEVGPLGTVARAPSGAANRSRSNRAWRGGLALALLVAAIMAGWFVSGRDIVSVHHEEALDRRHGGWDVHGEPVGGDLADWGPTAALIEVVRRRGRVVEVRGINAQRRPRTLFQEMYLHGPQYHSVHGESPEIAGLEYQLREQASAVVFTQTWEAGQVVEVHYTGATEHRERIAHSGDRSVHQQVQPNGRFIALGAVTAHHWWPRYEERHDEHGWRVELRSVKADATAEGHRHHFTRDAEHRVIEDATFDAAGLPIHDPSTSQGNAYWGVSGLIETKVHRAAVTRSTYGVPSWRRTGRQFIGLAGEPIRVECPIRTWAHDALGRTTSSACFDVDGSPMELPVGCAEITFDYAGGEHTATCRDGTGDPASAPGGWTRQVASPGPHGNLGSLVYVDGSGKPSTNQEGIHHAQWDWPPGVPFPTRFGPFMGTDGSPVAQGPGSWGLKLELDAQNTIVSELNLGPDGELHDGGFAPAIHRYQTVGGQVVSSRWFDAEANATAGPRGAHETRLAWGETGETLTQEFFDSAGNRTWASGGASRVTVTFDDHTDVTRAACYGIDDAAVLCAWDDIKLSSRTTPKIKCHAVARTIEGGRLFSRTCLGRDDAPLIHAGGWASVETVRGAGPAVLEYRFLDPLGKPVANVRGSATILNVADAAGRVVDKRYLNAAGDPTSVDGCHRLKMAFKSRTRTQTCFDALDRPVPAAHGCTTLRTEEDVRGNLLVKECLAADGALVKSVEGASRHLQKLDSFGRVVEFRREDADGNLVVSPRGAIVLNTFDAVGRRLRVESLDADGARMNLGVYEYDRRGGVVSHLVQIGEEESRMYREPRDEKGRPIRRSWWRSEDTPAADAEGIHIIDYEYVGEEMIATYLDVHGRPMLGYGGCHRYVAEFHQDQVIRAACFDADGGLTRTSNLSFAAEVLSQYDPQGRMTERRYHDEAGEPTPSRSGPARVNVAYNPVGAVSEVALFGVDDEPVLLEHTMEYPLIGEVWRAGPWSRRETRFDDALRPVDIQFFGVEGQPSPGGQGWSLKTIAYDPRGNPVDERWFDPDGAAVPGPEGCLRRVQAWSATNKQLEDRCTQ